MRGVPLLEVIEINDRRREYDQRQGGARDKAADAPRQ
jgi:hypothetical protein